MPPFPVKGLAPYYDTLRDWLYQAHNADGTLKDAAAIARADSRVFDVRAYGAVGTADDAATFQAAIDTANVAGGGIVVSNRPTHTFLTGLTLKDGVYLDLPESTIFNFSGMTAPVNASAIYGAGSLTALPALGANVAKGAKTITFASAPSVIAGDVIVLYNSTDGSFNSARTYYRAGEFLTVQSVSGSTVTMATRTFDAYASGTTVTAHKVTPIRTGIRGARMICKPGNSGIRIKHGVDITLRDLTMTGTDTQHIYLDKCYRASIDHVNITDYSPAIAANYGITIVNSQRIAIGDCFLETTRHGLTTGGDAAVGAVPNREITVHGGTISSAEGSSGADCHGNAEKVLFLGVQMPTGISIGGDRITVSNCEIGTGVEGYAVQAFTELLGSNISLIGNRIIVNQQPTQWVINVQMTANTTRSGTLRFTDNVIDFAGFTGATWPTGETTGIYVLLQTGSTAMHHVLFDGNDFLNGPTGNGPAYAVNIRVAAPLAFGAIRLRNNMAERLGYYAHNAASRIDIINNQSFDSPTNGIQIVPVASSPASRTLRVLDNLVERAQKTGINLNASAAATRVVAERNTSLNNLQQISTTGSSSSDSSIYVNAALSALLRDNMLGDDQSTTTQLRAYAMNNVATAHEIDNIIVGTVMTINRTTVTTLRFRGQGSGAPTFAAAVGSTYIRTDGGAGTTLYVNETGTTTWRAV